MICIFALSKVSRFYLVSVAEQACLNLTWSKIPKDTISRDVAQISEKWRVYVKFVIFRQKRFFLHFKNNVKKKNNNNNCFRFKCCPFHSKHCAENRF